MWLCGRMRAFTDAEVLSVLNLQGFQPEPDGVVRDLEKRLGVVFPAALKRIWRLGEESGIYFYSFAEGAYCSSLYALRTPHTEWASSTIAEVVEYFSEDFPNVIPIGSQGDGCKLVLDYRRSPEPIVLKFDIDIWHCSKQPFYYLARSVDEMVERGLSEKLDAFRASDAAMTAAEVSEILGFDSAGTFVQRERTKDLPQDRYAR